MAWRRHMLEGLCRIVDASVGISVEAYGWQHGDHPRLAVVIDLGWASDAQRDDFRAFVGGPLFQTDPQVQARARLGSGDFTLLRPEMVKDKEWYAAPTVSEGRRFAGIDHSVTSGRILPRPAGGQDEISLSRPWGSRAFGVRERRIVRFFHDELAHLWSRQASQPGGPLYSLPRHLRVTLDRLMLARSEKEAAADLHLSRHTLHAYARALYQRLGVASRAELLLKCIPLYNFLPRLTNPDAQVRVEPSEGLGDRPRS
jgi:hypothetical protein